MKKIIMLISIGLLLISFASADKMYPSFEITNESFDLSSEIASYVLNNTEVYQPEEVVNVRIPTLLTKFTEVGGLKTGSKISFNIDFFDAVTWGFQSVEYKVQVVDFSRTESQVFIVGSSVIQLTLKQNMKYEVDLNGDDIIDLVISYKGFDTEDKATYLIKRNPDLRYIILSFDGVVKKCFDIKGLGNYQCMNDAGTFEQVDLTNTSLTDESFAEIINDDALTLEQKEEKIQDALYNKLQAEIEKGTVKAEVKNEVDNKLIPTDFKVDNKLLKFIKENGLFAGSAILIAIVAILGIHKVFFTKKEDDDVFASDLED